MSAGGGSVAPFGVAPDGTRIDRVTIANGGALARILTWGATVQDFRLEGVAHPLVLGSPTLAPYRGRMLYFGAIVGRVANRIAGGQAPLDGRRLMLERNDKGRCTLHGGAQGSSGVPWRLDGHDARSCQMSVTLPDGQGGFPGALSITARHALDDTGALIVDLAATTDAPGFCNLAHHGYWTLDGTADLAGHRLSVAAEHYLPVDADQIPLGAPQPVVGTTFDHRAARPLTARLDHNFCLGAPGADGLRRACTLCAGGLRLTVDTTEPGLQVFTGDTIDTRGDAGLRGLPYGPRAGVALEPQRWPDAPNHPLYPSIRLDPGETYRQRSVFAVRRIGA